MRLLGLVALVLVALASPLACSGRYDGSSGPDGAAEAAAPTPTTSATSSSPVDASVDVASDAAQPSPCLGPHLFCDDFERPSLGDPWDGVSDDARLLALEASPSCARATRCLRARLDADPAHESSLRRSLKLPATGLSIGLTVALADFVGSGGGVGFLFVSLPLPGTRFRHFNFFASSEGISIQVARQYEDGGGGFGQSRVVAPFVPGTTVRVKLALVPRGSSIEAVASVNEGASASVSLEGGGDDASLVVGAPYRPGTTGGTVHVDDVVVDAL